MTVSSGLDRLIAQEFSSLHGKSIGVVCHQASVASDFRHILDHLLPYHESGKLKIVAAFGPQHGIWGHTQDNMIEWEGYLDARTGLRFFSLYGEHREPTPDTLNGVEELVFDVQDVGARYYTFIWTLANCLKACEPLGIPVTILDRPNPVNGIDFEGPGFEPEYESFVGLYPLAVRHGMTIGEVGTHLQATHFPNMKVNVVRMERWSRAMYFDQTGLPWAIPSPNMPTADTALVYPGKCLLEGTLLSEGRGTTRPFEIFGHPAIEPWSFCDAVNALQLPGVYLRPMFFQPTFQKHAEEICGGAFLHVTDREHFRPVTTTVAILHTLRSRFPDALEWRPPPYEYETVKLPFDILSGGNWLRQAIDDQAPLNHIKERIRAEGEALRQSTTASLLYD